MSGSPERISVVPRYRSAALGTRIFLQARWAFTPYSRLASKLPEEGEILDLGCGHGLLALTLALRSDKRRVLAIDHDPERVALAREAGHAVPGLTFEEGSVLEPLLTGNQARFSGITLIDVMHYFDVSAQERILKDAHDRLKPGGLLLVREVDPAGGAASIFNRVYEKLATATGFTRSSNKSLLHFRSPQGWTEALVRAGFEVTSERCSSPLFADILFIGRRKP